MALLGFEGFDFVDNGNPPAFSTLPVGAGAGQQTGIMWSGQQGGTTKQTGLLGGFAIRHGNASNILKATLTTNYTTLICGFRLQTPSTLATLTPIVYFQDGATTQSGVGINASGKLITFRNTTATVLATGTTVLTPSSWYYIEFKSTIDPSAGTTYVNLNGASEIATTSLNTRNSANSYSNALTLGATGLAGFYYDDFYVADTTGSPPYNDFFGICRVETLYPSANNSVAWTPNASTNVSRIQDTSNDSDTTYNSASGTAIDNFTHGSLSSTPTTIFAVDIVSCARKDDVATQNFQNQIVSGGTTTLGATGALQTSYEYYRDSYQTDPNTSAAWIAANVNSTDIGYKHV